MNKFLSLMIMALTFSCASAQKDYSYMNNKSYQTKSVLKKSLIDSSKPLDEKSIQKVLNSKIRIPRAINLAVTRVGSDSDFQRIDQKVAQDFYAKKNWGKRVQSIIPVPRVLIEAPISINTLRRSAVLLQADMHLIIMPFSYGDWKFQWFEKNKAKATTSLEVLLLDTRTGVIPFTSIITETVEVEKVDDEYSNTELVSRARRDSEKKALIQVAKQVKTFLNTIK